MAKGVGIDYARAISAGAGEGMSEYRCPIGSIMPTKMDTERIKAEAWQEQRILVVALDDERLDWVEREVLRKIGEKFYGG